MHPDIAAYVSAASYDSQLENAPEVEAYDYITRKPFPVALHFVDTEGMRGGRERRGPGGALRNEAEVRVAAQVVRLLDERAPRELSMAVIAMYAEQVERLRQALGRRRFKRTVKIDTVDSFEGREEDIVVISLVRSNERGRIGFLRVPNRLNVAISRAKRLVACIGDSATLRSGDELMYGTLVEASRSTGGWLSALELVSQPKPRRGDAAPGRGRHRGRERATRPIPSAPRSAAAAAVADGAAPQPEPRRAEPRQRGAGGAPPADGEGQPQDGSAAPPPPPPPSRSWARRRSAHPAGGRLGDGRRPAPPSRAAADRRHRAARRGHTRGLTGVSDAVTVFVRPGDPASEATLRYLDQRGVAYTKRDVLSDPSATAILFGRLGKVVVPGRPGRRAAARRPRPRAAGAIPASRGERGAARLLRRIGPDGHRARSPTEKGLPATYGVEVGQVKPGLARRGGGHPARRRDHRASVRTPSTVAPTSSAARSRSASRATRCCSPSGARATSFEVAVAFPVEAPAEVASTAPRPDPAGRPAHTRAGSGVWYAVSTVNTTALPPVPARLRRARRAPCSRSCTAPSGRRRPRTASRRRCSARSAPIRDSTTRRTCAAGCSRSRGARSIDAHRALRPPSDAGRRPRPGRRSGRAAGASTTGSGTTFAACPSSSARRSCSASPATGATPRSRRRCRPRQDSARQSVHEGLKKLRRDRS